MLTWDRVHRGDWMAAAPGAVVAQPISLWTNDVVPASPDAGDPLAVTLGLRFRSDLAGQITGVRFYKGDSDNGGTHQGQLWDNVGNLLGSVTFVGETASGWQQQAFAAAIPILANTTYVISYFAPQGHYAANNGYFAASGFANPPLRALQDGADGGNGVFIYGAAPTFPTDTFGSTNYWVDLVFTH